MARCESCLRDGEHRYWQSGGTLGCRTEAEAVQKGFLLHLCPTHDHGVNPGVWTREACLPGRSDPMEPWHDPVP